MSKSSYFTSFKNNRIDIYEANTGLLVHTCMVALPSSASIVNVSADNQAEYITASCSNGLIQVYKKAGPTSWYVYRTYYRTI